jgi:hypothetical protein
VATSPAQAFIAFMHSTMAQHWANNDAFRNTSIRMYPTLGAPPSQIMPIHNHLILLNNNTH